MYPQPVLITGKNSEINYILFQVKLSLHIIVTNLIMLFLIRTILHNKKLISIIDFSS